MKYAVLLVMSLMVLAAHAVTEVVRGGEVRIERVTLRLKMDVSKCEAGPSVTGLPFVGCSYALGFTIPQSGRILKAQFDQDPYFEVEPSVRSTYIAFLFRDSWAEESGDADGEEFRKEIAEYYEKHDMHFVIEYEGPLPSEIKGFGEPLDYNKFY